MQPKHSAWPWRTDPSTLRPFPAAPLPGSFLITAAPCSLGPRGISDGHQSSPSPLTQLLPRTLCSTLRCFARPRGHTAQPSLHKMAINNNLWPILHPSRGQRLSPEPRSRGWRDPRPVLPVPTPSQPLYSQETKYTREKKKKENKPQLQVSAAVSRQMQFFHLARERPVPPEETWLLPSQRHLPQLLPLPTRADLAESSRPACPFVSGSEVSVKLISGPAGGGGCLGAGHN